MIVHCWISCCLERMVFVSQTTKRALEASLKKLLLQKPLNKITINDITENPHNIKFEEIEAAQLPRTVQDVDFAVINGNYAMEAGFSVGKDALATEDASSEAAQTYANVLVVKEGRENDPAIQALYAALTSDKVKDYINSTYDGAVVPIF